MDPSSNVKASLAILGIAPFFIPLYYMGAALTPLSPLSLLSPISLLSPLTWSYSTWLFFIIPLIITVFLTVFAPTTRTFSGPLRFVYLEYTSHVLSHLVPLLGALTETLKTIPTLALPALFFLPIVPVLSFCVLPTLPLAWHYIFYHYRHRLEAVNAAASKASTGLDLAIARARRAVTLAHAYEKQALNTVSTTRRTALLTLKLQHTDFFDTAVSAWASMSPMTTHIGEVVAAAREASNKANSLRRSQLPGSKTHLETVAEEVFERANHALEAALKTEQLACQAQETVAWSRNAETRTQEVRQEVENEAERIHELGTEMANTVKGVENKVTKIEDEIEKARAVLEQAIMIAVEGEMAAAEKLIADAKGSLEGVIQQYVETLCTIADEARHVWVELAVEA